MNKMMYSISNLSIPSQKIRRSLSLVCVLFFAFYVSGQTVKAFKEGQLYGIQFLDTDDRVVKIIRPQFEDLAMMVKTRIGGVDLGEGYLSCRFWCDTEFIEVPIDPNDPEKVVVHLEVNDKKIYLPKKPIMAKLNGKWGLINEEGLLLKSHEYDEMLDLSNAKWEGITEERLPLLLLTKGKEMSLIDALDITLIKPQQFPSYMAGLKRKADALELCYFGNFLLINEGGVLFDSIIKVPAVKVQEKGKTVIKEPAYSYGIYVYKKGKFNVLNLNTGERLWTQSRNNVEILLKDGEGKPYFEALNPRIPKSVSKYQENLRLGITPALVEFIGKD
jgi:hypothetical protein